MFEKDSGREGLVYIGTEDKAIRISIGSRRISPPPKKEEKKPKKKKKNPPPKRKNQRKKLLSLEALFTPSERIRETYDECRRKASLSLRVNRS